MILNEWMMLIKDIHQQIFYGSVLKINHRICKFQSVCTEARPSPANVDKTRKASTDSEAGLFGKVRLAHLTYLCGWGEAEAVPGRFGYSQH